MDGWVTIGTKLDNRQLEADIKNAEGTLRQFEKENEKLTTAKAKIETNIQEYEKQKQLIREATDEDLKRVQTEEQVNFLLDGEQAQLQQLNQQYTKEFDSLKDINQKLQENAQKQSIVRDEVRQMNNQLNQVQGFEKIKASIEKIGGGIAHVTRKVLKWGLAVFGVHSAYMFVRNAISILSNYNEKLGADVEYIRFALASTLAPVVQKIIQLVYQLLYYLGYIIKTIFGVNIFANASVKAFQQGNKALKSSAGHAKDLRKEIQKTVAGFDEMNVLQEQTKDSGTGGTGGTGGGGGVAPSFDLSKMLDKEPDWSKLYTWTDKLKKVFNKIFDSIKNNIKKVMSNLGFSKEFIDTWDQMMNAIKKMWNGLFDFIGGLLELIVGLCTGDTEKVKEAFKKMLYGIIAFVEGSITQAISLVKLVFIAINDILIKPTIKVVKDMVKKVGDFFSGMWKSIKNGASTAWTGVKNVFSGVANWFKTKVIDKIVDKFKTIGSKVGNAIGGAFKAVINGVLRSIEIMLNSPIKSINALMTQVNKLPGVKMSKLSTFHFPRLAEGGIVNNPGKGVLMGNYIAGEKGAEAVLPLTDDTLQRLANMIPITVHVTNTMNGRVISRELQKVQNDSDFAFNR